MFIAGALLSIIGLVAFCGAALKARETRRDESRMASYIASLKAVAADQRAHIAGLEAALLESGHQMAAQERLLIGQAAHMRTLDPRYVG